MFFPGRKQDSFIHAIELKLNVIENKIDATNKRIEEHITQDEKVICKLTPIIEDYYASKNVMKRLGKKAKLISTILGASVALAGAVKVLFLK
jgi:hypothetical protein